MRKTKKQLLESVKKPYKRAWLIKGNTLRIHYCDGSITIRFHATDIITRTASGKIILNSGGWFTPTTKNRINEFLPLADRAVFQRDHEWYISGKNYDRDNAIHFHDGIVLEGEKI
jgi:hypothetical protein